MAVKLSIECRVTGMAAIAAWSLLAPKGTYWNRIMCLPATLSLAAALRPAWPNHSILLMSSLLQLSSCALFLVFPAALLPSGHHPNSNMQSLDLSSRSVCLVQYQCSPLIWSHIHLYRPVVAHTCKPSDLRDSFHWYIDIFSPHRRYIKWCFSFHCPLCWLSLTCSQCHFWTILLDHNFN